MTMVYVGDDEFMPRREYMDMHGIHEGELHDDPEPDNDEPGMTCVLCGNKNEGAVTFAIVTNTPYPVPCCNDARACEKRRQERDQ